MWIPKQSQCHRGPPLPLDQYPRRATIWLKPATTKPKARQLKMEDPHIVKNYLEYLEMHIKCHNLLEKTKQLANQLTKASDLAEAIKAQLNNIDNSRIQGML